RRRPGSFSQYRSKVEAKIKCAPIVSTNHPRTIGEECAAITSLGTAGDCSAVSIISKRICESSLAPDECR
ncbi:unnamed protein product, partial [Mycena citricolor]